MSKLDFIIHAGIHKTGTSSIQLSFRKTLIPGVHYLPWGPKSQHNSAYTISFCDTPEITLQRLPELETLEAASERQAFWRAELQSALKNIETGKVFISAEAIANSSQKSVQAFYDALAPFAKSFRVIVYVRHPQSYAVSALQQALKTGSTLHFPAVYKFKSKFSKLDEIFGRQNVELLPFGKEYLHQGDAVLDLARRLDLPLEKTDIINTNESISLELSAIFYMYWQHAERRKGFQQESVISREFSSVFHDLGTSKLQFSTEVLDDIARKMGSDINWLKERSDVDFSSAISSDHKTGTAIRQLSDLVPIALAQSERLHALLKQRIPEICGEQSAYYLTKLSKTEMLQDPTEKLVAAIRLGREIMVKQLKGTSSWTKTL